jgi:hypothetical protein
MKIIRNALIIGGGITISGAALRAFKTLGVILEIVAQGWCSDGCDICDASGATGVCTLGPCLGQSLQPVTVLLHADGSIYWRP